MPKKLTIGFVKKEFEKEGYILLSKEYVNAHAQLKYICPKGDYGTIAWCSWQQGHRCSKCFGGKRLTIEFVRKQFEKEGYILLSKEYINNHISLSYICPNGHYWHITWNDWQQGIRCAECAGLKKLTIEFIGEHFEKEGYVLLSKEYVNANQKLECICPKNHTCVIRWGDWQQGHRCAKCYYENNKGSNNPNYKKELTKEHRENGRNIPGYEEWKYAVKERYNFTCQICDDNKGGNLVSHHLESYNNNPKLRTALNNGICLCENCHNNFHHQYGRGNNTRKQFEEFISIGV